MENFQVEIRTADKIHGTANGIASFSDSSPSIWTSKCRIRLPTKLTLFNYLRCCSAVRSSLELQYTAGLFISILLRLKLLVITAKFVNLHALGICQRWREGRRIEHMSLFFQTTSF